MDKKTTETGTAIIATVSARRRQAGLRAAAQIVQMIEQEIEYRQAVQYIRDHVAIDGTPDQRWAAAIGEIADGVAWHAPTGHIPLDPSDFAQSAQPTGRKQR